MKEIKLPKGFIISAFNGPTESITPKSIDEIMKPVDTNKLAILDAAFDIERIIDRIISHHFFGHHKVNQEKLIKFENTILKSDWCTFSSKRKLVTNIINDLGFLEGQEKNEYDSLLRKTMSYRNTFAHGEVSTDGKEVRISYFEGIQKVQTLSDEYLSIIESDLKQCWKLTEKVAYKSGANKIKKL